MNAIIKTWNIFSVADAPVKHLKVNLENNDQKDLIKGLTKQFDELLVKSILESQFYFDYTACCNVWQCTLDVASALAACCPCIFQVLALLAALLACHHSTPT